jgi:hypothetical protein
MALPKKASDGSKLSCYHKSLIASSIFNYWTVKEKAIALGRLKSTRTPSFFEKFDGREITNNDAKFLSSKVAATTNREHFENLKFITENNSYVKDGGDVVRIEPCMRRTYIRFALAYPKSTCLNNVMRLLHAGNSNIPLAHLSDLFLIDSYNRGLTFHVGYERARTYSDEIVELGTFIEKVKRTVALTDKLVLAAKKKIDFEVFNYYSDRSRCYFQFDFNSANEPMAEDILNAKVSILSEAPQVAAASTRPRIYRHGVPLT